MLLSPGGQMVLCPGGHTELSLGGHVESCLLVFTLSCLVSHFSSPSVEICFLYPSPVSHCNRPLRHPILRQKYYYYSNYLLDCSNIHTQISVAVRTKN
jgi:hypothetical protein